MATNTPPKDRFGLHYFPDTDHYRENDLRAWLPELRSLGVSWLILQASIERAIPESFLKGIISAGIEPILHINPSLEGVTKQNQFSDTPEEFSPILDAYHQWGINYITYYDRPNRRSAWKASDWMQSNLVQQFLDRFVPLAELTIQHNMRPVLAPLEPGGDYWDTAFLRVVLQNLLKQEKTNLLDKLVLGAYANTGERALNWGIGGPERWAGARPYFTPEGEQDEMGFFIFDWYRTISQAVLGVSLPMLLFGAGSPGVASLSAPNTSGSSNLSVDEHVQRNISLLKVVQGEAEPPFIEGLPAEVLACNFWILATTPQNPSDIGKDELIQSDHQAWYRADGTTSPIVGFLRQWQVNRKVPQPQVDEHAPQVETTTHQEEKLPSPQTFPRTVSQSHPIAHYLLIPPNEQGEVDFEIAQFYPFIKKHNLTVGFSMDEASLAIQVTVLDHHQVFPIESMEQLRAFGCKVVRITGLGTELAQFLTSI